MESGTDFILSRVFMDGSEARLIYCWTRCCNLAGRFIAINSASVLSTEKFPRQGLELNLGDEERKCDIFLEVLALTDRIYLICFCVVGEILWKDCLVDGDNIGGTATGFGVDNLGS